MKKTKIQKIYQILDFLKTQITSEQRLELAKKIARELFQDTKKESISNSQTLTLF